MLVHVSYPYHAYLEFRQKIKNSYWMEHGKTFCNIFVADVHRENIPGFASNKSKGKTFDWFSRLKYVFVSFTSCLVQSILKKRVWLSPKTYFKKNNKKNKIFHLGLTLIFNFKKISPVFFCEIKTYKNEFLNVSAFQ